MKPFRKPFASDPLFPLELAYKKKRGTANELPTHLHDRYELVYIHEGSGVFFINHSWFTKQAGDLFLIPGNTIHHAMPDAEQPILSTAVYFAPALLDSSLTDEQYAPLMCYDLAHQARNYQIQLPSDSRVAIEQLLEKMHMELDQKALGHREATRLLLRQLLLLINRQLLAATEGKRHPATSIGPAWIRETLQFIDKHPEKVESVAQLARKANVSAAHYSRIFKQLTEMTVIDYISTKRILRARELLLQSDRSIDSIAEESGFQNPASFYRVFKKIASCTPHAFRKQQVYLGKAGANSKLDS